MVKSYSISVESLQIGIIKKISIEKTERKQNLVQRATQSETWYDSSISTKESWTN